jgi:hypothetical protein
LSLVGRNLQDYVDIRGLAISLAVVMEPALASPAEHLEKARGCPGDAKSVRRRPHRATRPQLLTRDQLDGRTNAAKMFDQLVADIESDLGGRDRLSTIQRSLIEGFVGAAVTLHSLNVRLALGQDIDLAQHAQAVSAMVRVATRLGVRRVPRDVTPNPLDYAREHEDAEP